MNGRWIEIKWLKVNDKFRFTNTSDYGGIVVRNNVDSQVVLVEQDSGQLTAMENNDLVWID